MGVEVNEKLKDDKDNRLDVFAVVQLAKAGDSNGPQGCDQRASWNIHGLYSFFPRIGL
ncbi:hypothetical protein D3C81_2206420 [compost metagenome]